MVAKSKVVRLLERGGGPVIVWERWARAAGATRWYLVEDLAALEALTYRLRPGSLVYFYADGRIARSWFGQHVRDAVEQALGDIVNGAYFGWLMADGLEIDMMDVSNMEELEEAHQENVGTKEFFYGTLPVPPGAPPVITLVVPDEDGVVRRHPH